MKKLRGYRVMRFQDGEAVSSANSRIRLPLQRNRIHRMPGKGMFLSTSKDYVRTHYAGHDQNVLLTYEFSPAQITSGNLTDREPEISVPTAKLIDWEIFNGDDELGRARTMARRRHKRSRPLRGTYRNPAAAIAECARRGANDSPGELYACALRFKPAVRGEQWAANAKRLARERAM